MAKVDMSPEAVSERLRLMGELCDLAMKLSQSNMIGKAACDPENPRADTDEECGGSQNREP
jgi:hypothetical protein